CIDSTTKRLKNEDVSRGHGFRQELRKCWHRDADSSLVVIVPPDSIAMMTSPELGEPILQMGDLISEDEIRGMTEAIGKLPGTPWGPRVQLPSGVSALVQHARYNRIESLSLGISGKLDMGPVALN